MTEPQFFILPRKDLNKAMREVTLIRQNSDGGSTSIDLPLTHDTIKALQVNLDATMISRKDIPA